MSSRQKRSSGGYGLRRKVAKKRLDEDFEYYFSKIGTHLETSSKPAKDTHLVMVTELEDTMKINESPEKKPRGRPRKIQPDQNQEVTYSDPALKLMDLKEKRTKKLSGEDWESLKAVEEKSAGLAVGNKDESDQVDCIVKRVKLESFLSGDGITGLQEEEVRSLPEGEKENLPEDGIHLEPESDPEEGMEVQLDVSMHGDIEERTICEEEDVERSQTLLKMKRKYKKGRLSQEAIQTLSALSPDDKIECSECHKLLKPSSFRQHLRTHTGEKPFGCEVCEARFTRKGDVERHVRIVHNKQKPFKCCRCQRAFGDKKNLRWHLMNHDKKLFYVCEVCGFKFGKREYWENHVRFIHPIPGGIGLDDSQLVEEEGGEDRLRTLTKTLLGDDESVVDDPSQDCVAAVKSIQNHDESVIPFISQCSKPEALKIINVKHLNLPNLSKIGPSKLTGSLVPFTRTVNESEDGAVEAVVIQFDGSSTGSSLQTVGAQFRQHTVSNLIQVVDPENVLDLVDQDEPQDHQPIVIETQEYLNHGNTATVIDCPQDVIEEQVVELEGGCEGDQGTVHYINEGGDEPSKVISVMLSEGAVHLKLNVVECRLDNSA